MVGESGTEQFSVETRVDGERISLMPIHDPFAHTTVILKGWRHAWNALRRGIRVTVAIDGTHGAIRGVMGLDPVQMQADTEQNLIDCAKSRERMAAEGVQAFYSEARK